MRKLHREPLSEHAASVLCYRTQKVANAGNAQITRSTRAKALRAEVNRLWSQKDNQAFDEIRRTLKAMAPGVERCMYCEGSEGTDIEHFWPKSRYPWRAYTWENYLWACSACNSNHKRERFPMERGRPLLINPTEDEPQDHLGFSHLTGEYAGLTGKGENSIEVFGLNRHALAKSRRNAWTSVQAQIISYASACKHDVPWQALDAQRTLCQHPHASVLAALLRVVESPVARGYIHPACLDALASHQEIWAWLTDTPAADGS